MNDFEQAIQRLWDRESRKFNIDSGGIPNKFGVNQSTFDDWRDAHRLSRDSVANLGENEARSIAYELYWLRFGINKLPEGLRYLVFQAVYEHTTKAIRWLQEVLGIAQDGKIGPMTLAAIDNFVGGISALQSAFAQRQESHYKMRMQEELAKGSKTYPLKGLLNRVAEALQISRGTIGAIAGVLALGVGLFF